MTSNIMESDEKYMRRALQLAAKSLFDTHPNPMVGAVIVCDGVIIGEGYHRRCGEGHAEVNAIASVKRRELLKRSTIYVTLEPCSHYGKTPPCAKLIIESGIPRVVVAAIDPFEKVSGRGIAMMRNAGIEVVTGVLEKESRCLNERFFTAHTLHRPFITLKWAQSADGFMDHKRDEKEPAARFSKPLTMMLTHRQRALHDAILTTAATVKADNPALTVRQWNGPSPRPVVIDRHHSLSDLYLNRPLVYTSKPLYQERIENIIIETDTCIGDIMTDLYNRGITSVLVESGPRMLQTLLDCGLWDTARVETSDIVLGLSGRHTAPTLPSNVRHISSQLISGNRIDIFKP